MEENLPYEIEINRKYIDEPQWFMCHFYQMWKDGYIRCYQAPINTDRIRALSTLWKTTISHNVKQYIFEIYGYFGKKKSSKSMLSNWMPIEFRYLFSSHVICILSTFVRAAISRICRVLLHSQSLKHVLQNECENNRLQPFTLFQ